MTTTGSQQEVQEALRRVIETRLPLLEFLPHDSLVEKLVDLVLRGAPTAPPHLLDDLERLRQVLLAQNARHLKVVVFGGGTGLSNVIGGDSRTQDWPEHPFNGVKELFPRTTAVVCVTDDGGSTGELLKDMSVIGLGDLRHVLLASVQEDILAERYGLEKKECLDAVVVLHRLFNLRFDCRPASLEELCQAVGLSLLPEGMRVELQRLLAALFEESLLENLLLRQHCLGNLLLAAAIYLADEAAAGRRPEMPSPHAILAGVTLLAETVGADPQSVLPCTTTPAQLKILYANGVIVSGEYKSSQAHRNCPIDRVFVEFAGTPEVPPGLLKRIAEADLILFAPGSLYTSIIPVLQVPGLAEAVRENCRAAKILVANIWAQRGETDLVRDDPKRRFYVSDLICAYERNIPGGLSGLFRQILILAMQDIRGSVIQNYAVEGKVPIYLDRERVCAMGFQPIEACIFSEQSLTARNVLQHDPIALARAVHVLWHTRVLLPEELPTQETAASPSWPTVLRGGSMTPCARLAAVGGRLAKIDCPAGSRERILAILWRHFDILPEHLDFIGGVRRIAPGQWRRSQEWDKIYAFYDPADRLIKIREDVELQTDRFEVGFLVSLGQSLLGNYAAAKEMQPIEGNGELLGKVFLLTMRPDRERHAFLSRNEFKTFLNLARMVQASHDPLHFTRLVNGEEGFTPPGLLFGLTFAWYLDNRFASHVEYKMSIRRIPYSDLIPEQLKTMERRMELVEFFRQAVFRQQLPFA